MDDYRVYADDYSPDWAVRGDGRRLSAPSASRAATTVRLLFGVVFAFDALLKWLPGYRQTFLSQLRSAADGQPAWLGGWFHFWIALQSSAPLLFAVLTAVTETSLALVLLHGVARRAGYTLGIAYMSMVWSVGEGFGGPYTPGATDVGTAIPYIVLFTALLTLAPPARDERLSLDRVLVGRWPWWRMLAEPHAMDRGQGAPVAWPAVAGQHRHRAPRHAGPRQPGRGAAEPGPSPARS
jgi:nitrite reductase (NO-forming)